MRLYYINDKDFKDGPYNLEALKLKNISKETPIWFEDLNQWVTAKEVEELECLFLEKE